MLGSPLVGLGLSHGAPTHWLLRPLSPALNPATWSHRYPDAGHIYGAKMVWVGLSVRLSSRGHFVELGQCRVSRTFWRKAGRKLCVLYSESFQNGTLPPPHLQCQQSPPSLALQGARVGLDRILGKQQPQEILLAPFLGHLVTFHGQGKLKQM